MAKVSPKEYEVVSVEDSNCPHVTALTVVATPAQHQHRRCLLVKLVILTTFVSLVAVAICCHTGKHKEHKFGSMRGYMHGHHNGENEDRDDYHHGGRHHHGLHNHGPHHHGNWPHHTEEGPHHPPPPPPHHGLFDEASNLLHPFLPPPPVEKEPHPHEGHGHHPHGDHHPHEGHGDHHPHEGHGHHHPHEGHGHHHPHDGPLSRSHKHSPSGSSSGSGDSFSGSDSTDSPDLLEEYYYEEEPEIGEMETDRSSIIDNLKLDEEEASGEEEKVENGAAYYYEEDEDW